MSNKSDISVAIIDPNGGHGGMDYYDFGMCHGLLAAGCRVGLYTCDETVEPDIPGLRFHAYYKRVFGHGSHWRRGFRYLRGMLISLVMAILSGERICHFHLGPGSIPELSLVALAKLCGRKIIITVHDVEPFVSSETVNHSIIVKVYRLADGLIVHNETSKLALIEKLGIRPEKISIIPHGNYMRSMINVPQSIEAKRDLGISESKKVVLFFGQIKDVKGLDLLIEAIPAVAREVPEVTVLIAGRPWRSDYSQYEALMDKLGVRSRCISHIRFIPNEEVAKYFAAADVVALPYRRIYQSGVLLMAMSYERTVIVSDLPGMLEIVTDGVNGFVFTQGSTDDLERVLIGALRDETRRRQVSLRASEYVQKYHDWDRIGRRTAELYRAVLES
jgi:glycosyltransferase involved in cell wall biosynthesis